MKLDFAPGKRLWTLANRGLDFARATDIFAGPTLTRRDERFEYGEERYITYGLLDGREVIVV